jgi:hypothetical protein
MRTHCITVAAQSEDKQPVADLNRTRLGEWEGSVSLALPPQAFAPVFAAAAACACGPAQRFAASGQAASLWPPSLTDQRGASLCFCGLGSCRCPCCGLGLAALRAWALPAEPCAGLATTYRPASRRVSRPLRTMPFMVGRTSLSICRNVCTASRGKTNGLFHRWRAPTLSLTPRHRPGSSPSSPAPSSGGSREQASAAPTSAA